jgi:LysM repeat protein
MNRSFLPIVWGSLVFVLVFSALPTGPTQARPFFSEPIQTSGELISAVNSLRASNGLPPYSANPILMQIAQAHADYMAATGSVTHYGPDGSRPFQRALAAGYPVAGDLSRGGWFSENIQAGSGLSPSGAVTAWQGDAPHLNTMLSPNLFDVGAGVSKNGSVVYYVLDAGASGTSSGNPGLPGTITAPGTPLVSQFMVPVTINTPEPDGSVFHEVQYGQSLWSIAIAYDTKIDSIKALNNLPGNDIQPGQKLLVKKVLPPLQVSDTPTATPLEPTSTQTMDSVLTATATFPVIYTRTPVPPQPEEGNNSVSVAVMIMLGTLLFAGLGTWLGTRRSA